MRGLLLGLLLALPAQAQEWNNACFHGLNDADSPAVLGNCESPDLLNVESNLQGTAIIKRKGFSKFADLTITTAPANGSHSFIDSSGNRLDIVCQDMRCLKSTNGNAFTAFLTTAAAGITRWSFVDQGGVLYGANDRRDPIFRYDGTTFTSPIGMPAGSILELTQDRLAVGDISGEPNRIHFSSAGAYEQFTVGVNPEDSFFDDVGAAGDRIRGIKCVQGACFIFKTASITLYEMGDQYTTQGSVISPSIGTTDPASIVAAGPDLYFRAQDKNFWRIGRGGLEPISKKIPNLVASQSGGLGGGENTNTQTTAADWNAGDQEPDGSWNTTTTNGSIFPSSVTIVETSSSGFAAGVLVNVSTSVAGEISMVQSSTASFINAGAESGDSTNIPTLTAWAAAARAGYFGSNVWEATSAESCDLDMTVRILDSNGLVVKSQAIDIINSMPVTDYIIDTSTLATNRIYLRVTWGSGTSHVYQSAPFIRSAGLALRVSDIAGPNCTPAFDVDEGTYTYSGSIVSQGFDTTYSSPTWGPFTVGLTSTTIGAATFQTQVADSVGGSYDSLVTATPGSAIGSEKKRAIKYKVSFSVGASTDTAAIVTSVSLPAATTGQFVTQCIQPNSSISAWGTLSCAQTLAGAGSLVYYATSAVTCAALPVSTAPVNAQGDAQAGWTQQTNNSTLSIATNTAVFIGWRSLLGSSTDQAQVDACVLSWNEGTPAQPSWAVYDSRKQAVYWTSTIDGASATNRLLKYDLNLGEWFPWDIAAQAPRVINNELYFGGATAGTWSRFGLTDSDDGAAINAYWTSKDIGGERPFQEKDFKTLSILNRNQGTGSMTGTWTNSIGATGSYTISLSTGSGLSYARSNYNLPKQSPQQFMKIRVGNDSAVPFQVLGLGLTWTVLPWRVAP